MKITLTILLIVMCNSIALACSCIGENSPKQEFRVRDIVVEGKVISKTNVIIWSDTSQIRNLYNSEKSSLPYEEYKVYMAGIQQLEYKVIIKKRYKGGRKTDTLSIRTGFGNGDCGFHFIIGESYLIYGYKAKSLNPTNRKQGYSRREIRNLYYTNSCTRTIELNEAKEDLKYLNKK